ncbi:hypothetical protein JCM14469_20660 [Desulfatiferula olefinivorans]
MFLAIMVLFVAAQGLIHRLVILPGFLELEAIQTDKNVHRADQIIRRELFHLSSLTHDWAAWDDTYDFMETRSDTFARINLLPDDTFTVNHLQLLMLVDPRGGVVWSKLIDPDSRTPLDRVEVLGPEFPTSLGVFDPMDTGVPLDGLERTGVVRTPRGPLMVSIRPVLTSTNDGPSRGTLIMGRFLTPTEVLTMIRQTEVHFRVISLDEAMGELSPPDGRMLIEGRTRMAVDRSDRRVLQAYTVLPDINDRPAYVIKTIMTRTILREGLETLRFSMMSILAVGVLLILLSLAALHGSVLGPLATLARHVRAVEESGDLGHRMALDRTDEIGALARQFDAMLEKLADIRLELLERSYHSGLAGMTSDVLHQGRNILMPLSQSLDRIRTLCAALPGDRISQALSELEKGACDPARRADLHRFLCLSAGELPAFIAAAEQLLDKASAQNHSMERLFRDLEPYSRIGSPASEVEPAVLVRQALSHLPESLKKHWDVVMGPGLESLGRFHGEQLVLTQVFASVLSHAAALADAEPETGRTLTVDARIDRDSGPPMLRFVISAPGRAPDEDRRKKLFAREYHAGERGSFCSNLHWCCNVVAAMNGTLVLTGGGLGIAFHLLLPGGGEA